MPFVGNGAEQRHAERSGTYASLHHARAGKEIGPNQDRPKVFGINNLSVARQIGNKLWQTRAENQERLVHRGADDTAFLMTDDIFDGKFSSTDRDGPISIEPQQVLSVFAVQENHRLVFLKRSA